MSTTCYFAYWDPDTNSHYFYDPVTGDSTFDCPQTGEIRDPDTNLVLDPAAFPKRPTDSPEALAPIDKLLPYVPDDMGDIPDSQTDLADDPSQIPESQAGLTDEPHDPIDADDGPPPAAPDSAEPSQTADLPEQPQRSADARKHRRRIALPESDLPPPRQKLLIDVPEQVKALQHHHDPDPAPRPAVDVAALVAPTDFTVEIEQFQVADFAERFFRKHRTGPPYSRKVVPLRSLTQFQTVPLKKPLLQNVAKRAKRAAVQCFKHILSYTGADPTSKPSGPMAALKLVQAIMESPELRDEVYFQLIKQTRNNPRPDCCLRTWDLFLIVATLCPSSRESENWVKSHLARYAKHSDAKVADIAQFAYIRFNARCGVGKDVESVNMQEVSRIPRDPYLCQRVFGASVYEQLWSQRVTYPNCPFPIILNRIAQLLLEKGVETTEGSFRRSGNVKKVQDLEEALNTGKDLMAAAELHDLCSLFKTWFMRLPDKIVSQDLTGLLRSAIETADYASFMTLIPPAHLITLKYLIGFLKRIRLAEPMTKMSATNLAICFAPVIVFTSKLTCPVQATKASETSQHFTMWLLNNLQTDDVYPPPPEFVTPNQ
jgi:hypothetical protein